MLHLRAIMKRFMKNKYIHGAIWIIVSSSATYNGYIFDWVVGVIVRIYICRSIGVRERGKISSQTTGAIIGVCFVHDNSISRWLRYYPCFSDFLFRQDVPGLTAVARPQRCLFILAAHYGPCGTSDIAHLQLIFIDNKLCCLEKLLVLWPCGRSYCGRYVNIRKRWQW